MSENKYYIINNSVFVKNGDDVRILSPNKHIDIPQQLESICTLVSKKTASKKINELYKSFVDSWVYDGNIYINGANFANFNDFTNLWYSIKGIDNMLIYSRGRIFKCSYFNDHSKSLMIGDTGRYVSVKNCTPVYCTKGNNINLCAYTKRDVVNNKKIDGYKKLVNILDEQLQLLLNTCKNSNIKNRIIRKSIKDSKASIKKYRKIIKELENG